MMYKLFLVLIFTLVVNCNGQNSTGTGGQSGPDSVTDAEEKTALQKGMDGIFSLNHNFLDTVMSSNFYEESDKFSVLDLIRVVNQSDYTYLQDNWRDIADTFGGYAACIIVGLIFVLFMPIIGILYCCCHCCCHRCGGTKEPMDPSRASCKRWTLFFLLFGCATMMLAGCIILFLGGELLHRSLSNEDNTSMLGKVDNSLIKVDQFLNNTVAAVRQEIDDKVIDQGVKKIKPEITGAAQKAVDNIAEFINATSLLDKADALGEDAKKALDELINLNSSLSSLKDLQTNISSELAKIKGDVERQCNLIGGCSTIDTTKLEFNANFSTLDNLQNETDKVINAQNITGLVQKAKDEFIEVKARLKADTDTQISHADDTINELNQTVHDNLKQLDDLTKPLSDALTNAHKDIEDMKPTVKDVGTYIWYSCVGMGCVVLLVIMFYYMGLLFGWCGERPSHNANCCNRGTAANLLCTGICCTFLFCWLLMLMVILLFSTGGLTYSLACKYVGKGLENVNVFEDVLRNGFNYDINDGFGDMKNLSLASMFEKCKNNEALYQAVNLKYVFDIDDVVNISDIVKEVDKIKDQSLTLPNITLLTPDLKTQLDEFADAALGNVDYTEYLVELGKPVLKENLTKLIEDLRQASITFASSNAPVSTSLNESANDLENLQDNQLAQVSEEKDKLSDAVAELKAQDGSLSTKVTDLKASIKTSEDYYNAEKETIAKKQLKIAVDTIVDIVNRTFEDVKDFVKNDLGRCKPLYEDASELVDAVCLYTVDPLNAIWFGLGWSLFFYIPCFIFAALLAGLYKRQNPYEKYKQFDDIQPYNGYAGNDDQMQLTSMDENKGANRNRGVPNNGYQDTLANYGLTGGDKAPY